MYKIVVAGAGSSQSNGVINCLLKDEEENEIIGIGVSLIISNCSFVRGHRSIRLSPTSKANGGGISEAMSLSSGAL